MSNEKDEFTTFREARQKTNELRNLVRLYRFMKKTEVADLIERVLNAIDRVRAQKPGSN